ncbi:MAG: UDP-N-acetylmuramoyl-L-alanine--D-glutamate ligase, partial [Candidatus Paceibacterota bacterium]
MEVKGKKVTVMGLGLLGGGLGTTKWLANQGAEVLVTDLKSEEELKPSLKKLEDFNLKYVLGEHRPEDFKEADLIVKNPAVEDDSKFLKIARENNIPVETEISLFFKFSPCPIIGITGTKGKSTVATLTHKLLKEDYQTILGGNIKTETLPKLKELDEDSLAILELSSWQLSSLDEDQISPHGAIITNIKQDHLNRYNSFEDYVEDKSIIYKHQTEEDYLVLNHQDVTSSKFAESAQAQVYYYNFETDPKHNRGAHIKNDSVFFGDEEVCKKKDIKLSGDHNLSNVLAAVTMAKVYGVANQRIKETVSNFKGLPHRLELVKEGKIDFYNDTCATNPAAAKAALESFDGKIVLIAGGAEKDLDFEELAETIAE